MILKNKKALVLSSLLTLLPILVGLLLWNRFPEQMVAHWGLNGQPDGYGSIPFAVFVPSLLMLAVQWLCILFTAKDPGNKERNTKPLTLVLWIIPILSNLSSYTMYALALGVEISPVSWMLPAIGLLFTAIGNYMPKIKPNSTVGIRVPWTYSSKENWNATHRFGGKCWVAGGLVMVLSSVLPGEFGVVAMLAATFTLAFIPIVYSYWFYRKQRSEGVALIPSPKMSKSVWVAIVLLVIFLVAILFAGDLEYEFLDRGFIIEADFYSNYSVLYEDIQSIEYREGNVPGMRVGGYGSFRLLMGYFSNEEFGIHTRYTYYKPEACIVLNVKGKILVLSGETAAETEEIYNQLLAQRQS